jgi:DNA-binding SARP family transcriptional activator
VAEARRAYEHCRRTLRAELGIEPSSSTSALVGAVRVPPAAVVRRPAEPGVTPARPVGVPVAVKA